MKKNKALTSKEATELANVILSKGDWKNDYQFRCSDYFFLRDLSVKSQLSKKQVLVAFTLEYKTNAHKVINNVSWCYPYDKVNNLEKDMEKLELDIMLKTSDPDIKDQVFNKRFNRNKFNELNYSEKGWIIKK